MDVAALDLVADTITRIVATDPADAVASREGFCLASSLNDALKSRVLDVDAAQFFGGPTFSGQNGSLKRAAASPRIRRRVEREVSLEAQVTLLRHRVDQLELRLAALERK